MKIYWKLFLLIFLSAGNRLNAQNAKNLIPAPVQLLTSPGHFKLTAATVIVVSSSDKQVLETARLFSEQLAAPTGYKLKVVRSIAANQKGISFKINKTENQEIGSEGYQLKVTPSKIEVSANQPAGLFYGIQSLMQLLPASRQNKAETGKVSWNFPAVDITDYPRFGWRGLMLDVSRHFFPKEFIKKYIDQMVKYKYNLFHWHLTDDPGWRIEIKKYPKLTDIGAWRVPRTGKWGSYEGPQPGEAATDGGFYTQSDIREIVKYAQDRYVTIVPEIDIPGHSAALIVAYPQVSCSGEQYAMYPGSSAGLGANVLCAGNEESFKMLEGIFSEIADLFPGQYVHAGGDEVNKDFWKSCAKCQKRMKEEGLKDEHELQSYVIKRTEKILASKGKKMIGWDEILEGGLAPNAAVMSWRGPEGGIAAAKAKHNVVMSPLQFCYLDYQQTDMAIAQTGGGFVKLSDVYRFEPVPEGVDAKYVLGGQGNLWTEFIASPGRAENMTWPRAFALSEILWSPRTERDFSEFSVRVESQLPRFVAAGVNYSPAIYDPYIVPIKNSAGEMQLTFHKEVGNIDVFYTFDATYPDRYAKKYQHKPVDIPKGASEIRAITYRDGKPIGRLLTISTNDLKARLP